MRLDVFKVCEFPNESRADCLTTFCPITSCCYLQSNINGTRTDCMKISCCFGGRSLVVIYDLTRGIGSNHKKFRKTQRNTI